MGPFSRDYGTCKSGVNNDFLQVHNLPKELLSKRDVVQVDIVNDPVSAQVCVYIMHVLYKPMWLL